MTEPTSPAPDFTSPIAGRIEVRVPCSWCVDGRMIPSHQFDEHVMRLHPGVQTVEMRAATTPSPADPALRDRIAAAARTVPLRLGPNAVAMAQWGEPIILNLNEADALADAVLAVHPDAEAQRLALSLALDLGTGAPWDAIRDRAAEVVAGGCNCQLRWDEAARETGELRDRSVALHARAEELEATAKRLTADRAAHFREAADELASIRLQFADACECGDCGPCAWVEAERHLRRLADEAQQGERCRCSCGGWFPISHLHADAHEPADEARQAPLRAELKPWQLLGETSDEPTPQTEQVVGGRRLRPADEVVHACPPDGTGLTPCCGRTPLELPLTDRISSEAPATCRGQAEGAQR